MAAGSSPDAGPSCVIAQAGGLADSADHNSTLAPSGKPAGVRGHGRHSRDPGLLCSGSPRRGWSCPRMSHRAPRSHAAPPKPLYHRASKRATVTGELIDTKEGMEASARRPTS